MEKQKTAMQELIEYVESQQDKYSGHGANETWRALQRVCDKSTELLPNEREQMITIAENAYWDVIGSGVISTTDQKEIRLDAEKLFTETFGNHEQH